MGFDTYYNILIFIFKNFYCKLISRFFLQCLINHRLGSFINFTNQIVNRLKFIININFVALKHVETFPFYPNIEACFSSHSSNLMLGFLCHLLLFVFFNIRFFSVGKMRRDNLSSPYHGILKIIPDGLSFLSDLFFGVHATN